MVLTDGRRLTGNLIRFDPAAAVLGFRWFIPADAIASYQIGDQLGKILVDQKILTPALVDAGLEKQRQLRSQKLGDYLTSHNIVTQQTVS